MKDTHTRTISPRVVRAETALKILCLICPRPFTCGPCLAGRAQSCRVSTPPLPLTAHSSVPPTGAPPPPCPPAPAPPPRSSCRRSCRCRVRVEVRRRCPALSCCGCLCCGSVSGCCRRSEGRRRSGRGASPHQACTRGHTGTHIRTRPQTLKRFLHDTYTQVHANTFRNRAADVNPFTPTEQTRTKGTDTPAATAHTTRNPSPMHHAGLAEF